MPVMNAVSSVYTKGIMSQTADKKAQVINLVRHVTAMVHISQTPVYQLVSNFSFLCYHVIDLNLIDFKIIENE